MIIVSNSLDNSSSGLVIENFIGDVKDLNLDYIGVFEEVSDKNINNNIINLGKIKFLNKFSKIFIIVFKISPFCYLRSRIAAKKLFNLKRIENDKVFIFVTGVNFFTIYFYRQLLKKHKNLKLHVHFLDTIISKNSWGENKYVSEAKRKIMKHNLSEFPMNVTFSFTNIKAKEFIEKVIDNKLSAEIYYSYPIINYNYSFNPKTEILFYYRGSLDFMRNADYVLRVLNDFAQLNKNVRFIFQGNIKTTLPKNKISNIEILEYSRNTKFLNQADVFLDVDLSLPDVFIPGKLFEYLSYRKPIVSITPEGSSVRNLLDSDVKFNDLVSVCSFQEDDIFHVLNLMIDRFNNKFMGTLELNSVKTLKNLIIGSGK